MLVYLNSGHDVATPYEMKDAIEAYTGYAINQTVIVSIYLIIGVKGTKVAVVKVNRENENEMKARKSIPGISKMYSFSYER